MNTITVHPTGIGQETVIKLFLDALHVDYKATPQDFEQQEVILASVGNINRSASVNADIEKQFNELAAKWKSETGLYATTIQKVNDTYLEIIFNGKIFLPYILMDLEKGGSAHWHTALKIITGYNPFPDNDLGKSNVVRERWVEWGKKKKII